MNSSSDSRIPRYILLKREHREEKKKKGGRKKNSPSKRKSYLYSNVFSLFIYLVKIPPTAETVFFSPRIFPVFSLLIKAIKINEFARKDAKNLQV